MDTQDIADELRKHPKAHIYYTDNGSWVIYKEKPLELEDWLTANPEQSEKHYFDYERSLQLCVGDDADGLVGYVPLLVEILGSYCGFTFDSI